METFVHIFWMKKKDLIEIPVFIPPSFYWLGRDKLRFRYKGQIPTCWRCNSPDHLMKDCNVNMEIRNTFSKGTGTGNAYFNTSADTGTGTYTNLMNDAGVSNKTDSELNNGSIPDLATSTGTCTDTNSWSETTTHSNEGKLDPKGNTMDLINMKDNNFPSITIRYRNTCYISIWTGIKEQK